MNINMPGLQIFKHIKLTYGIVTLRNRRILPNSINYKPPIRTNYAQQIVQSNGCQMLNVLISDAHNRLCIYQQR